MRAAVAAALLAIACNPPCERTCRKLLTCGNLDTDRLAIEACERDCQRQGELYDTWRDERKQKLFIEHKRCLLAEDCEAIEQGACYDGFEDLFIFSGEPPTTPTEPSADPADTGQGVSLP